jgi:hypothetical protein
VETAGVEPAPPRCKRGAHPHEPHPRGRAVRTGGVEPPQRVATALQAAELSRAQRPREKGAADRARTGTARITTSNAAVTPQPPRAGTAGLEPAAYRLTSERSPSELRPRKSGAGGIRTHGLELMRLARTAAPLPRCVVVLGLAGWSRTSDLRRPKPAGWPSPLQPDELRWQDSNLLLAINSRASCRFDYAGVSGPGRSRTCTVPIKSRQLCRLSYGAVECGRQESNLRRVAFQATALPG